MSRNKYNVSKQIQCLEINTMSRNKYNVSSFFNLEIFFIFFFWLLHPWGFHSKIEDIESILFFFFADLVYSFANHILNPQMNSVIIFSFYENSNVEKNRPWKNNSPMEKQFDNETKFDFEKKDRF